jgi:predicted RNA binding protein YcfA (HicA-like mRNA interferase family)
MAELYRDLVRNLEANGCYLVRKGKGSHEIWYSPVSNRNLTVPRSTKSRHTANDVLKQAGLARLSDHDR